jgi:hypothetical protein
MEPDRQQVLMALMLGRRPEPVCEAAVDLWERLSRSLIAIIGPDGFDALFDRSLHLTGANFPALVPSQQARGVQARLTRLMAGLQAMDPVEAGHATALMLATFTGVLGTLIGHSLTTNILRAAWGDAYDQAAQETTPCPTK